MTDQLIVRPENPCGTGVLTIRGSSGKVDGDRARLLASHGALAITLQWFGGDRQQPGPWEVPLETFTRVIDHLAAECDRVAIIGASFGAEAALLTATVDRRIDAVVACAPTSVVWAGIPPQPDVPPAELRQLSHWTWQGTPQPFVPIDVTWEPPSDPPAYADLYRTSLQLHADRVAAATIPVERIAGDVVLVAGGDDQVWPSAEFASDIERRRHAAGLATTVVTRPAAGHYLQLPGEPEPSPGARMARGGSPEANRELGALAWPQIVRALALG